MYKLKKLSFFVLAILSIRVEAFDLVGKIHTIHTNTTTRLAHIKFVGDPTFGDSDCSSIWTGNSMDDTDFKTFVLPLLITAQATDKEVRIWTTGCTGSYPKISGIDLVPR